MNFPGCAVYMETDWQREAYHLAVSLPWLLYLHFFFWGYRTDEFYDLMTVHRNRFLVNKTNRCTEFQFYWYYDSTCFAQPFCPSSGVRSRISALVDFMQLFHPTPGSKRSQQLHKMYQSRRTATNPWWRAQRLPETCRVVIPITLEFGASLGFIHKERMTFTTTIAHLFTGTCCTYQPLWLQLNQPRLKKYGLILHAM